MSNNRIKEFFGSRLEGCDALLIDKVNSLGAQKYEARILSIYTSNFEGPEKYRSGNIEFIGTPGAWGNPTLSDGEKALTFIGYHSDTSSYYEHCWHAHFSVRKYGGIEYAIIKWNQGDNTLWPKEWEGQVIYPNKTKPWETGVPFSLLEEYLFKQL